MKNFLTEYYRVPENLLAEFSTQASAGDSGFFKFGPDITAYGRSAAGTTKSFGKIENYDAAETVRPSDRGTTLPFQPAEVVENLRHERYFADLVPGRERFVEHEAILKAYYSIRPLLPVFFRRGLQRAYFSDWRSRAFPQWPVDSTVDVLHQRILGLSMKASGIQRLPFIWFWPDDASCCLLMTHDVETKAGRDFSSRLMDLDDAYRVKSSFQVIPEQRYEVPDDYVQEIKYRGFEFNVHDLNHDGRLYQTRQEFLRRAKKINAYVHRYQAKGFRAGAMYRHLDWYDAFEFSYDMSSCSVAHLEPKRGGCCTVLPFFVGDIVELPLTTSQDYSVFHILNEYSLDLWKRQMQLIKQNNGLMSFLAHPDYLINRRARKIYESLLDYLRTFAASNHIWWPLPGEVDSWWRSRSQMKLVQRSGEWVVEGPQSARAAVAYAVLEKGRLTYELAGSLVQENVRS
jgi:hypothetical protein